MIRQTSLYFYRTTYLFKRFLVTTFLMIQHRRHIDGLLLPPKFGVSRIVCGAQSNVLECLFSRVTVLHNDMCWSTFFLRLYFPYLSENVNRKRFLVIDIMQLLLYGRRFSCHQINSKDKRFDDVYRIPWSWSKVWSHKWSKRRHNFTKIIGQSGYSWEATQLSPTHGINITTDASIITTQNKKQRFFCLSLVLSFDLRQITRKFCLYVALVLLSCEWAKINSFGRVQPKVVSRSCDHHWQVLPGRCD